MGLRVSRFGLDFYGLEVLDKIQGSIDRQRERERGRDRCRDKDKDMGKESDRDERRIDG